MRNYITGEGGGPKGKENFSPHWLVVEFLEKLADKLQVDQRTLSERPLAAGAVQSLQQLEAECRVAVARLQAGDTAPASAFLSKELRQFRARDPGKGERYRKSMDIIERYENLLQNLAHETGK